MNEQFPHPSIHPSLLDLGKPFSLFLFLSSFVFFISVYLPLSDEIYPSIHPSLLDLFGRNRL
jgi:hypothetical protein